MSDRVRFAITVAISMALINVGLVSQASAGVLDGYAGAYNDGSVTWTGSAPFSQGTLVGYVDYAVFGPGQFPFAGYTPTVGELTYVYQVFETGSAPLSSFSVTLSDLADSIGSFNGLAGMAPNSGVLVSGISANWTFAGIVQGSNSEGLVFSSIRKPQNLFGSVVDTGQSGYAIPLPSPSNVSIPEPTSILIALGMSFGLPLIRRRREV